MVNIDLNDVDLSNIGMCIMRLCGRIAAPGPPSCDDREDCPGKWWKLLYGKKD